MGTFVTQESTPNLWNTKTPAPGVALRSGWTVDNVLSASEVNTIEDSLLDLRAAVRGREFNVTHYASLSAAVTAAASGDLYFPPGTYAVTSNLSISARVVMGRGASFSVSNGITLTLNGGVEAGLYQIFSGAGTVVFDRKKQRVGHPEWWGCVPGDSGSAAANLTALGAAIVALPVVQLQSADYWISNTLKITTERVQFLGNNQSQPDAASEARTRLIVASATADCLQIGPDSDPGGGVNNFTAQIQVRNIEFTRSVAPNAAAIGSEIDSPAGLRIKYAIYTYVDHCWSSSNTIGYVLHGTVQTNMWRCFASRNNAGGGANPDFWWGWYLNGSVNISLAGGNASSQIVNCTSSMGGAVSATGASPITSVGFNLNNKFADTFLHGCETSACQTGIWAAGTAGQNGNVDLLIKHCRVDTFTNRGIYVQGMAVSGVASILGNYCAPGAAAAIACYEVRDSGGMTMLLGNQAVCHSAVNTIGVYVISSSGVQSKNMISGSQRPVALDAATNCVIEDSINASTENTLTPAQGAVWLSNADRCIIRPLVKNTNANKYTKGIQVLSTTSEFNEFNCTGIDPAALTGGLSANKLSINSVDITATGLSGNNLVSGVMA